MVTASRMGLVQGFTPGLDLGPCSTPGRISPVRGWVLEGSDEESLARGGMCPGASNTAQ